MTNAQQDQIQRRGFTVGGQVQGVGFRPFVYRLASELHVTGYVRNTPEGVRIEVQGSAASVAAFGHDLHDKLPPLARIVSCTEEDLVPLAGDKAFEILASTAGEGHNVLISPDTATCPDCLADITTPGNRRYLYPFTNCTNCGPRYTITRAIPYDRPYTSMACFPLCPECGREYHDPLDRRFHAQPNACPVCGPHIWLTDPQGEKLCPDSEAVKEAAKLLCAGKVLALKGLGGFHLACLAGGGAGRQAVAALRLRKQRPHKPLALMVPDLETARTLGVVDTASAALLSGTERPIVLCRKQAGADTNLEQDPRDPGQKRISPEVSPDTDYLGLMLPYTPLHFVLFLALREYLPADAPAALVMTSGNMSHEPIALGNREALARLREIADVFLLHNRDILIRTDDSVVRTLPTNETQFFRRARGYTPRPVFLTGKGPSVLGLGPELKNTLCLTKDDQAFVSQHIGDLKNLETYGFFQEIAAHLQLILETRPVALVRDLHPDYLSTQYALEQTELPVLALQHHYAHIHAVLAEHRHDGPAIGLALDGTGYGADGTLWGGECLFVDTESLEHRRLAHFSPLALPGGEAAIIEPWRIAQSFLWSANIREPGRRPWPWLEARSAESALLPQLLERKLNCPQSTSCGRLFDAVAAMLGCTLRISYEGQAAILLEDLQDPGETGGYSCPLLTECSPAVLDTRQLFAQVYADWEQGVPEARIARRFHLGLIQGLAELAAYFSRRTGVRHVALSGGVMQNRTLTLELPEALIRRGLVPLLHREFPPNDGCISLGQAAWARKKLAIVGD